MWEALTGSNRTSSSCRILINIRSRSPSTSPIPAPTTSSTSSRLDALARRRRRDRPLDDYFAKYMNKADLDDYHPLFKALPTYKGKVWGFFDDGDMFALYYRKDIFEDPKLKDAYQKKFSKALAVPKTWEDYPRSPSSSPTRWHRMSMAPRISASRQPGQSIRFSAAIRTNGGKFFDDA